jgi:hypothetical protein
VDASGLTQTATLTPTSGTSIINNTLALQATLSGGSFAVSSTMRVSDGQLTATSLSYSNFSFSVAGTSYPARAARSP